jgi:hypothetical protein
MSRFHNAPDKRALSVTVLRTVCSADVRAEAPTDFGEKTDRHRQGCVQKPCSRSSLWADCMRRCNSHGVWHPNCSLGWLGVLATARHQTSSAEELLCQTITTVLVLDGTKVVSVSLAPHSPGAEKAGSRHQGMERRSRQKPASGKRLFNECEEDAMAMITDAGSPSLIWSFLPASFFLV